MKIIAKSLVLLCAATPFLTVEAGEGAGSATNAARPRLSASDLFANTIVARGQGVSVSRSQLDEAMIGIKSSAAANNRTIPAEHLKLLERQILQRLIHVQLLNKRATDADKQAGRELAEKRLADFRERAGSDERLEENLRSIGFSRSELTAKMAEEATAETVLKRELKTSVSEEEIKSTYEEHSAQFEQPEMVRAAHILFATGGGPNQPMELTEEQKASKRKVAEDVLKRARAGEDFAALAKEFSEDPGSKDTGGEYTFPRGQMTPQFEAVAFSLGTNQISDLVETDYGYHIIKGLGKSPAKKAGLNDVVAFVPPRGDFVLKDNWIGPTNAVQGATNLSAIIRQRLEIQNIEKEAPAFMARLEKEAAVEILDEDLKPEPDFHQMHPTTTPRPQAR